VELFHWSQVAGKAGQENGQRSFLESADLHISAADLSEIDETGGAVVGLNRALNGKYVATCAQVSEIVEDAQRRVECLLIEDPMCYEFRYISVGALLTRRWFPGRVLSCGG
jgi:hypothetical protein